MLDGPVDAEQAGVVAADPEDVGAVVDVDPEVAVGDATGERLGASGPARPEALEGAGHLHSWPES